MPYNAEKRRLVYQEYMKRYLRCVRGIDDNIGKVLDYLDTSGLAKNTVVIYTSDQGFFLGEHGLYDKRLIHEPSLRIPLIVRWPGVVDAGTVNFDLTLNLDFPETILDIAGHPIPDDMQGRSLTPLLRSEFVQDWRQSFTIAIITPTSIRLATTDCVRETRSSLIMILAMSGSSTTSTMIRPR